MLLSPRLLYFTAHCLYFEWLQHTISEVEIDYNINGQDDPSEAKSRSAKGILASQVTIDRPVVHGLWLEIVFQYTKKDLTQDGEPSPEVHEHMLSQGCSLFFYD